MQRNLRRKVKVTVVDKERLPYGISDIAIREGFCPIAGCATEIRKYPSQVQPKNSSLNYCPRHKIYCRGSLNKYTYIFGNYADNLIVGSNVFNTIFIENASKKHEVQRIGYENSEDALSWNVFVSLKDAGLLKLVASMITGKKYLVEPELLLWGYYISKISKFDEYLESFRNEYEKELPVKTEPDIMLEFTDELILIEAKFSSGNKRDSIGKWQYDYDVYGGVRVSSYVKRYGELMDKVLNDEYILRQKKFCSQLIRYALFGYYKSQKINIPYYIVNLIPRTKSTNKEITVIEKEFPMYLKNRGVFKVITWEGIYEKLPKNDQTKLLRWYLEEKTASLKKAFDL